MLRWQEVLKDALSFAVAPFPGAKPGVRVLCYHAVGTPIPGDAFGLSIPLTSFRGHMNALSAMGLSFIHAEDAGSHLASPGSVAITFDDGFADNLEALEALAESGLPSTLYVTSGFVGKAPYMTSSEVKRAATLPGCRIGAHGKTHIPLAGLDAATQRAELSDSKAFLEDLLGHPVDTLAFPHGSHDATTKELARDLGFAFACSTRPGANTVGDYDPYAARRFTIGGRYSPSKTARYALGGYDVLSRMARGA